MKLFSRLAQHPDASDHGSHSGGCCGGHGHEPRAEDAERKNETGGPTAPSTDQADRQHDHAAHGM